jgi:hypothetical protein
MCKQILNGRFSPTSENDWEKVLASLIANDLMPSGTTKLGHRLAGSSENQTPQRESRTPKREGRTPKRKHTRVPSAKYTTESEGHSSRSVTAVSSSDENPKKKKGSRSRGAQANRHKERNLTAFLSTMGIEPAEYARRLAAQKESTPVAKPKKAADHPVGWKPQLPTEGTPDTPASVDRKAAEKRRRKAAERRAERAEMPTASENESATNSPRRQLKATGGSDGVTGRLSFPEAGVGSTTGAAAAPNAASIQEERDEEAGTSMELVLESGEKSLDAFLRRNSRACATSMTMAEKEQMELMAIFMHDYVGGTVKAAKAMAAEIGDLRTGMAEQTAELRSSMTAQSVEMRTSMATQSDDLRSSMVAQGDKMVADLGARIDEQISAKLDEHKIQELVDGNAKSLAASREGESASRELRKTFEEFIETQRRAIQNQPPPFTGFSGPPSYFPGYHAFGGFPGTQGGHGGVQGPTGWQEDQSTNGPGPTGLLPGFIQPGRTPYRAPPAAAAAQPWPSRLGQVTASSSGQAGIVTAKPLETQAGAVAGAVASEPQETRRREPEEKRNCTLRCVGMTVTLPDMSERAPSFSWVEIALRSMIEAGISEEESTTPEGLLMQELRILDDISIRFRGIQEGSHRSLAAEIGRADSNRFGVLDDIGEQAAFKAAGLPFLVISDLFAQSACTKLARPLLAATTEELLATLRTRGEMMLAAATGAPRRNLERGPVSAEDLSQRLESALGKMETTPTVQLILDSLNGRSNDHEQNQDSAEGQLDLDSAEGQHVQALEVLIGGVTDQKRANSPGADDEASPTKKLRGLELQDPKEPKERAASEERPQRAASTAAVARLHTHFGLTPHAAATATAARLQKTPQHALIRPAAAAPVSPTPPIASANPAASSTASKTATATAEERAQTAAASAAAPHPDV